jgi:hypothetical protein
MHRGGWGDARASCASPLGTPLPVGPVRLTFSGFGLGTGLNQVNGTLYGEK